MASNDIVVAITGASGAAYGMRLIEVLLNARRTVHLSISPAACDVLMAETGRKVDLNAFDVQSFFDPPVPSIWRERLHYHHYRNFQAGIASGSFLTGGMVICPCSMGTVAAVAHGISENVIHRAADVHLKERRKLVLVPRETPLGIVQLRNLTAVAEAGAIVLPAMPAFYTKPQSIGDMVDFIVGRICDQVEVEHSLFRRWGGKDIPMR